MSQSPVPKSSALTHRGEPIQPWQADWPECEQCGAKIDPCVVTGHHFSPYDCIRHLRAQRDAAAFSTTRVEGDA